jgi:cellulose synthase/poly-beta-1,6-N-acetylglucosamine synthase-like glycosyltransferase
MSVLLTVLRGVLWLLDAGLCIITGYLLLLTVSACFARRRTPARPAQAPRWSFLILVPAHNEEKLLPDLLANLRRLEYPSDLVAVHVVADNCTDATADVARQGGAIVHERTNPDLRGKGYALNWLIEQLAIPPAHPEGRPFAIVIIDADTVVSENFLAVMEARLARGERAIQAYYAVRDPVRSWTVSLRYVALAVLHYLRPQGRMVLGASAGLKGNGMVFSADILTRHPWSASLTEDIEYHMALILDGERVAFAPDAVVWAEMPGALAGSRTQNVRWERGRLQMAKAYVPRLLSLALRRRSFLMFDAAMEHIIPPFSIVAAATGLALLAGAILGSPAQMWLALALLIGQALYTLAGLLLVGAPAGVYLALLAAPALIVWKTWLYARVLLKLDRQGWTRTTRN